jgi:hypothetical protein
MANLPSQPVDMGFASAAKTSHKILCSERHKKKLKRLKKEAKAAKHKAQAKKKGG